MPTESQRNLAKSGATSDLLGNTETGDFLDRVGVTDLFHFLSHESIELSSK